MRPIVDFDNPDFSAIDARDQWVAFFGDDSKVSTITSSILSNRIDGGRPGLGSSSSPSSRWSINLRRHLLTVLADTPNSSAMSLFDSPESAHANTIRDLSASAWEVLWRRTQRFNSSRSAAISSSGAFGRPVRAMTPFYN